MQSHAEWDRLHESGPNWGKNADGSPFTDYVEFGILPLDQTVAGKKVIDDNYADTVEKAKAGNIEEINPEHYLKVTNLFNNFYYDRKAEQTARMGIIYHNCYNLLNK